MASRPFESAFGGDETSFIGSNWANLGDFLGTKEPPAPRTTASIPSVFSPFPAVSSPAPEVPYASELPVQPTPFTFNTPARSTSASPSRLSNPPASKVSNPSSRFSSFAAVSSRSSLAPVVEKAKEATEGMKSVPEVKGEGDGGEAGRPLTPKVAKVDPTKLLFTPKVASFTTGKSAVKFQSGSALKLRSSVQPYDTPSISRLEKPSIPPTPVPPKAVANPIPPVTPLLKRKTEAPQQTEEKRLKIAGKENSPSEGKIAVPQWLEDAVGYIEQRNTALEASRALPKPQTVYFPALEVTERRKRQHIAITQMQLEAEMLYCQLLTLLQDFNEGELLQEAFLALSLT